MFYNKLIDIITTSSALVLGQRYLLMRLL